MFTRSMVLVAAVLLGIVVSNAGYCGDAELQMICDSTGCHTVIVVPYDI